MKVEECMHAHDFLEVCFQVSVTNPRLLSCLTLGHTERDRKFLLWTIFPMNMKR